MRYPAVHKQHTRHRILVTASRQFRKRGADVVRVDEVMRSAGLTHGGFYKHFRSKDDLLIAAIETALETVADGLVAQTQGLSTEDGIRALIDFYLSEEHLRHPESGCAFAALGADMARLPYRHRQKISRALDRYAARLRHLMPGTTEAEQEVSFRILFSSMAGCLTSARAAASPAAQARLLSSARQFFLNSIGTKTASSSE